MDTTFEYKTPEKGSVKHKELETQRYNIIGGRELKRYNEEDGYKLIKWYAKRFMIC